MQPIQVQWTAAEHGTGITELDDQHRELFRRINLLLVAVGTESEDDAVRNMLGFLTKYMSRHFQCEEGHMVSRRCRGCTLNAEQHMRFASACASLCDRVAAQGVTGALATDLRHLLVGWANGHIPQVDVMLRDPASKV